MSNKEIIVLIADIALFIVYIVNYLKKDGASLKLKRYIMLISTILSFIIGIAPGVISLLIMIVMETRYRGAGNGIGTPIMIFVIVTIMTQFAIVVTQNRIDVPSLLRNLYGCLNLIIYIIEAKTYIIVKNVKEIY